MPTPRSSRAPHLRRLVTLSSAVLLALSACSSDGSDDATDDPTPTTSPAEDASGASPSTSAPERPVLPEGREIEVQVPAGYDAAEPAPLVVLLHGFGVDGPVQDAYFKLSEAADQNGMLAVFPSGTENDEGERFWNATDACCAPEGSEIDDAGYLLDVIATVEADYAVDPKQIFLVGHSNGGFMSFRMACDHADVIAAIVTLAASTTEDPADCTPSEPVSTLQIHGTGDQTISYTGDDIRGRDYPGARETLARWAALNGCDPTPDEPAPEPRSIIQDAEPATVIAHSDCDPGGHAELWTAPGGVHIPAITPDFSAQVLAFLLAHPKP